VQRRNLSLFLGLHYRPRSATALLVAAMCAAPQVVAAQAAQAVRVPHDQGAAAGTPTAPARHYGPPESARQRAQPEQSVPSQYAPPAGMCRVWVHGVPPSQQPAPTDCARAVRVRSPNSRVVFGKSRPTARTATGMTPPSVREPGAVAAPSGAFGRGPEVMAREHVQPGGASGRQPAGPPPGALAGPPPAGPANGPAAGAAGMSPGAGTSMSPGAAIPMPHGAAVASPPTGTRVATPPPPQAPQAPQAPQRVVQPAAPARPPSSPPSRPPSQPPPRASGRPGR
jgi:hypothetical protein